MSADPKQFWEDKILEWEEGRYKYPDRKVGLLEQVANKASDSLRFRLAITPDLLKPFVAGKHIVELGCGSGLLAPKFMALGAKSYLGLDIAERAIEEAHRQFGGTNPSIRFEVGSVTDMRELEADIVVSLGLLDWLTDAELAVMFDKSGRAEFFHAIAEKRNDLQQYLHRSYVQLAYGHKTGSYRPRYFTVDHIERMAARVVARPVHVFRDKRLSFGALISTLPIKHHV